MQTFISIYLPIFVIIFILTVFVVPSVRVYKQTGVNPFMFITRTHKLHDYVGAAMKVFIVLILAVVLIHAFSKSLYDLLVPVNYLQRTGLQVIGLIIAHCSLVMIVIAQKQMQQSWRIGIDYRNKTELVTTGLFKNSRNPIYLFLLLTLIGLFLVLPNAVTFAVLFSAYLILHITMRLEEEYLEKQHGAVYTEYMERVKRLL